MTIRCELNPLPRRPAAVIMRARIAVATFATLCVWTQCAFAQEQPAEKRDDLDVTMQIIVDPDAKLPDAVVRRIPLPAPKPQDPAAAGNQPAAGKDSPAAENKGQESAREAQELGRGMAEQAKQKSKEAAEQREQATRSTAEERRRNPPGPPAEPPGRPPRPPGR
jgi:hypothetical protein